MEFQSWKYGISVMGMEFQLITLFSNYINGGAGDANSIEFQIG